MKVRPLCGALAIGVGALVSSTLAQESGTGALRFSEIPTRTTVVAPDDYGQPTSWVAEADATAAPAAPAAEPAPEAAPAPAACQGCQDPKCDCKKLAALAKSAGSAYKPLFYQNDFKYLCDPCYDDYHLGEELKRNCLGDCAVLDIGGQYRMRYHNEHNHRGLGLTGRDDSFLLHRTRLYGNLEYSDFARAYVEGIDAESNYEDFAPRAIEENRTDLLNAFGEVRLLDGCRGDLWARAGRFEMLFGEQRVVSPLDWANTRRTFEGGDIFWRGENWNVDAFYTHPIAPVDERFDTADQSREFSGLYSTYKGRENETIDAYYLRYVGFDEAPAADFEMNTFGARWGGSRHKFLWEAELAYQDSTIGGIDQSNWAYTLGFGRKLNPCGWESTLWAYYDWAEGDENGNGYHHQFPLAHKYLGFMDLFGRRNIEDLNFQYMTKPSNKLKLLAWWHIFHLQNSADVPYTVQMTPSPAGLPGGVQPGGSAYLGQELDLIADYQLTTRTNLVLGYSRFFAGEFFDTNPTVGLVNDDADFYYAQFQIDF